MKMTALKDFRGRPGEGNGPDGRFVQAPDQFTVSDQARADYLERMGLALPVGGSKAPAAVDGAAVYVPREGVKFNEAAEIGPLASVGGGTGGETPPSSSPAGHQRSKRGSKRRGTKPAS